METILRHSDINKNTIVTKGPKFFDKDLIRTGHSIINYLVRGLNEYFVKDRRTQTTSDVFMSDVYALIEVTSNIPDFNTRFAI